MKKGFENFIKKVVDFVYKHIEEKGSGNMILITAIIGFTLSTLAQTGAIITNKKYSTSEKAFMVPQEITEGMINIFSLFIITKPLQNFAKKYTKTGKILTKDMKAYLEKHNLLEKRGEPKFDLKESINTIISDIEHSDKFIRASKAEQDELLGTHRNILQKYEGISDSVSAVITTAGGVLSTALIAPCLRNTVAADYQKVNLNVIQQQEELKRQLYAYKVIKANPAGIYRI